MAEALGPASLNLNWNAIWDDTRISAALTDPLTLLEDDTTIIAESLCRVLLTLCLAALPGMSPAAVFEISEFYAPSPELAPGHYACVSGLDFDELTWEFDMDRHGKYRVRGIQGKGQMELSPDGSLAILSGPFSPSAGIGMSAMNTTRLSDGNAAIIIRYDFGTVVSDDICALVRG